MKIVILEDEKPAADKLKRFIRQYDPSYDVIACLPSIKDAVSWFAGNPVPDLLFADIKLADGLSFEILKKVKVNCPVIFTTAYDEYAIDAFEFNGIGYLLKPFSIEKLSLSLEKFKTLSNKYLNQGVIDINQLIENITNKTSSFKSRFLVKNGNKINAIKTNEIAYFYTDNKLSFLITRDNRKFPVDFSLDDISQMVNPREFFRINRKFVIHIDSPKEINPYFKGRLKITLSPPIDEAIIISSDKAPVFKSWLDQ